MTYFISSGVISTGIILEDDYMLISSGGVAKSTTVNSGCRMYIFSGGTATAVVENGGVVDVYDGANVTFAFNTINGLTLSRSMTIDPNFDRMTVHSNTVANCTTVNSGGEMTIWSGGLANSTTINSGGYMLIFSGGVAKSTTVNSNGIMNIYDSGCTATEIVENGGMVNFSYEANVTFASNTINKFTLSGGGMTVHSNTVANSTTINTNGWIYIYSGGVANRTTVNSSGGMCIELGGVANSTTVNSGGKMYIYGGGVHSGVLNIESGGVVSAYSGSIISIDLADRNEASPAVINDISKISGAPTYTINVTTDISKGKYKLAGNAADFTKDINITVNGSDAGVFKYDNGSYSSIKIGDEYYTLALDQENNLCLKTLPCISIDYSIDEIDQIVYYHGDREDEFDGVVMEVPYSATATITLDKDTPNGQYEFVTVLDGIDKAEQKFTIQVLDGMPIYLSSNACYYGTQISETAENSTWTIKVNDFVLTEEIQKTMTVTPKYGSLLGTGLLLAVGAVFLTGCSGDDVELLYDGKNSDANKDGYYLECHPQYKNTNGELVCLISLIPNIREKTQRIDVQLLDEATGKVDKITAEMNLIQYDYADMSQDLKITIPANSLNRDYGLEFTVNKAKGIFGTLYKLNSDGSKVVISDICESNNQNIGFHVAEDQTMHCWAAVAANMLCDAGYLGSVSAQTCFEYWSKAYYRRNGNISKMTSVKRVIDDLGINDIYKNHEDVASGLEHLERNPTNIGCIALEEKHGVTCYAVDLKRKKITITDSDQYLTRNTRRVCDLVKDGNEWYIRNYSKGTDWKITGVESIIPKASNNLTYYYTSITPSEITEKVSAQNAVGVLNMDAITVINGSIEEAIVEADGILEIADGATGDTIILHDKAVLNLKSGATVRGKIMTHGGTISTESGVLFEEAEINFVISMLDGKKEAILDDLGNVGNMPLNVTVMAHQANGEYILADGAEGFNGEITIHGEYGNSNQLKMGFEVGELGTLKAGEELKIGDQVYSLDVENNQLIFRVSSAPLAVWNVFADITYLTESAVTVSAVFSDDITVKEYSLDGADWELYDSGVVISDNVTIWFRGADANGIYSETVSYDVNNIIKRHQGGTAAGLTMPTENGKYLVEYSKDNFNNYMQIFTTSNQLNTYGVANGCYNWQFWAQDTCEWWLGNDIVVTDTDISIKVLMSETDGNMDLFFGNAKGTWEDGYSAKHTGSADGWSGTGDKVYLTGKNKIADIFVGSADANVLVLTDDSNGDALFVDDIFTALPDSLTEQQARFEQIDEIRAGAGDDVVDMTSSKFAYVGNGVKIYGGSGNDTIWANNGNNCLFGDSGNDRIVGGSDNDVIVGGIDNDRLHGGGGEDIFCFGENWGRDTVEQLTDGEVILWFESGSTANWDEDTLTYTDGKNTVTVTGVSADNITLKFGDDGSARYDELAESGCFEDSASEKIFEDKNKGYLA